MATKDFQEVVRLATALTSAEAHLLQQKLEEEGINGTVVGDYAEVAFGETPVYVAEVWVRREDLPAAKRILDEQSKRTEKSPP